MTRTSIIESQAVALLKNYGIGINDPDFLFLRDSIITMRVDWDFTWPRIEAWIEDRI